MSDLLYAADRSSARRGPYAVLAAALATALAAAPAAAAPPAGTTFRPPPLSTLRRIVHRFDFEDAEQVPLPMPAYFYRYGGVGDVSDAAAEGFPMFGQIGLTRETAWAGNWSLGFTLGGGSLSARVTSAVLPAVPGAAYLLTVRVRTEGLEHARARLAAWMYDQEGRPLPGTRIDSRLVDTGGSWSTLSVRLAADDDRAADLGIELLLLQPRQYLGARAPADRPLIHDTTGRAWFDDLLVMQVPRVELSTDRPANLFIAPDAPRILASVYDPVADGLPAALRIIDIHGATVHREIIPSAPRPHRIDLAGLPFGWYRAVVELEGVEQTDGAPWLDLLHLPPAEPAPDPGDGTFGVALPLLPTGTLAQAQHLVRILGADTVLVPVETGGDEHDRQIAAAERRAVAAMADASRRLIIALDWPIVAPGGETRLEPLLTSLGSDVRWWRLGALDDDLSLDHRDLAAAAKRTTEALADFVPSPLVFAPWPVDRPLPATGGLDGYHVRLPHEIPPPTVAALAEEWQAAPGELLLTIAALPAGIYRPDSRATDLARRTLHAWRAGLGNLLIEAPWAGPPDQATFSPDPIMAVWRTLAARLRGRRFVADVPLGDGLRGWLIRGDTAGTAALIVWAEGLQDDRRREVAMNLGSTAVQVVDLFGNRRTISPGTDGHRFEVTAMPAFVENADLELALLRRSIALEPALIASAHRRHEHVIVLANPWSQPIAGTLQLHDDARWRITPRVHQLSIGPGETARLPVSIVIRRSATAGPTWLPAKIDLSAPGRHRITAQLPVEVGLPDLDVEPRWWLDTPTADGRRDLLIGLRVTNRGDRSFDLDAILHAGDRLSQRLPLGRIDPGRTVERVERIPDGARTLSGRRIQVGIDERNGSIRLLHALDLPRFPVPAVATVTEEATER